MFSFNKSHSSKQLHEKWVKKTGIYSPVYLIEDASTTYQERFK